MIYLFLAKGFEEIEALATADVLRRAGRDVRLVGVGDTVVVGSHGIAVVADCTESEVDPAEMEMVVLPGGMPGAKNLAESPCVQKTLDAAVKEGRHIAAICAAPAVVLGQKGLLKDRRATCFPGFEDRLNAAEHCTDAVVTDGNITTGRGAGVAVEFGLELVRLLCGEEKAEQLRASMQCIR